MLIEREDVAWQKRRLGFWQKTWPWKDMALESVVEPVL